jgi:hypothetical protein
MVHRPFVGIQAGGGPSVAASLAEAEEKLTRGPGAEVEVKGHQVKAGTIPMRAGAYPRSGYQF